MGFNRPPCFLRAALAQYPFCPSPSHFFCRGYLRLRQSEVCSGCPSGFPNWSIAVIWTVNWPSCELMHYTRKAKASWNTTCPSFLLTRLNVQYFRRSSGQKGQYTILRDPVYFNRAMKKPFSYRLRPFGGDRSNSTVVIVRQNDPVEGTQGGLVI